MSSLYLTFEDAREGFAKAAREFRAKYDICPVCVGVGVLIKPDSFTFEDCKSYKL